MNTTSNHMINNLRQRELKLRGQRQDILSKDGQTALEMILDAQSPAALTQSFPDQDLYYLMHHVGPDDFIPVLALAKSEQWEHILDVEVWQDDRLNPALMGKSFNLLYQADPERFLRWIIKEKPDYFEFFLSKNMAVHIREHDEPPPSDFEDYITLDDKFYFRFPGPNEEEEPDTEQKDTGQEEESLPLEIPELIEMMMKKLASMDLSVFHALLLETESLLPAETEEEQYRLKTVRLAEKGFLPPHEAIGIYQGMDLDQSRKRKIPAPKKSADFDPGIPLPPQFFSSAMDHDTLFVRGLSVLTETRPGLMFALESELGRIDQQDHLCGPD